MNTLHRAQARLAKGLGWVGLAFIALFVANVVLLIASVTLNSFSTGWYGSFLPQGLSTEHYRAAGGEHDLVWLIAYTGLVTLAVVASALVLALPASYVLARRQFRGKALIYSLLLLPMMVPPMTYGIPLASAMYKLGLSNTTLGVVLANLVPTLPFVIMILVPFIEQIDRRMEDAARLLGARPWQTFKRVLIPLVTPGMLTAGVLCAVRTIAAFELTYLVSGSRTQTLVVAVYNDAYGAGSRAAQQIDAMAVIYTVTTMALLAVALTFVSPKQFVYRAR
jgi:putative spermidine/putrescine transport system permease protein